MWIGQSQQISISLPADQIEALKEFIEKAPFKPSLSKIMQVGMTEFLEKRKLETLGDEKEKLALFEEAEAAGVDVEKILTEAMRKAVA